MARRHVGGRRASSPVGLLFILLATLAGCRPNGATATDTPEERESPQASAQPALLAVAPTTPASAAPIAATLEGGPPPTPLRGDDVLAPDTLPRESAGYTLSAAFRLADVTGPTRAPEVNNAGLDAARKATELRLGIDLSPTRMRVALQGRGFVLPPDTELRARADRFGHVVVWPGAASYRPLAPGSMRALLGERRFDVAPITPAEIAPRVEGGRRIGIRTHRVDVTTRAAQGSFEIGKLEGAGDGGILLCRLLLDLMNAPPGSNVCGLDELPVRAELRWTSHGSLVFELTGALRRTDIPAATLLTPPQTASFAPTPLPVTGVSALLSAQELAALRTSDVDVPTNANVPGDALTVINPSVELRVLFLDGVPIAWAAPQARGELHGLRRGRYVAQWRTFLGDSVETALTQTVPGVVQVGAAPDAGR
ncbi:MAG: hypothetical protein KIS78_34500 [Labilithrix sp.]|nr:hypothetical protein [Labilithrix sp.]MCW5837555.1 hypothetical protein [Labilithrix sp.]